MIRADGHGCQIVARWCRGNNPGPQLPAEIPEGWLPELGYRDSLNQVFQDRLISGFVVSHSMGDTEEIIADTGFFVGIRAELIVVQGQAFDHSGNSTTMIDICLRRVVHKNVFRLAEISSELKASFKDIKPGDEIVK